MGGIVVGGVEIGQRIYFLITVAKIILILGGNMVGEFLGFICDFFVDFLCTTIFTISTKINRIFKGQAQKTLDF